MIRIHYEVRIALHVCGTSGDCRMPFRLTKHVGGSELVQGEEPRAVTTPYFRLELERRPTTLDRDLDCR